MRAGKAFSAKANPEAMDFQARQEEHRFRIVAPLVRKGDHPPVAKPG